MTVMIGPGKECLLGTALLAQHRIDFDYRNLLVKLLVDADW